MNKSVKQVFESYPQEVKTKMIELRTLIFAVAETLDQRDTLEETLKWGEPSYVMKGGTAVRIDWKAEKPEYLGLFFHCQTKLIDTFRVIHRKGVRFEGNRAVLIDIDKPLPESILRQCLEAALTYHKRKKLPLLGL